MHLALQDLSSACPNPRLHTGQNLRLSLSPTTSCSKLSYCSCTNFPRPKRTPSIFAASVNRPGPPMSLIEYRVLWNIRRHLAVEESEGFFHTLVASSLPMLCQMLAPYRARIPLRPLRQPC